MSGWWEMIEQESQHDYLIRVTEFILAERRIGKIVYPDEREIYKAFHLTPFENVKVVIIGQDPYHNGHAHGLAFSSLDTKTPYSLQVIFKEVCREYRDTTNYKDYFKSNDLTFWAEQGVLLLNAVLTVEKGKAGSHKNKGWENLTKAAIRKLVVEKGNVVFMLWGGDARNLYNSALKELNLVEIANPPHVLIAGHPASGAYSKDLFTGCNHFKIANQYLINVGIEPISWIRE